MVFSPRRPSAGAVIRELTGHGLLHRLGDPVLPIRPAVSERRRRKEAASLRAQASGEWRPAPAAYSAQAQQDYADAIHSVSVAGALGLGRLRRGSSGRGTSCG